MEAGLRRTRRRALLGALAALGWLGGDTDAEPVEPRPRERAESSRGLEILLGAPRPQTAPDAARRPQAAADVADAILGDLLDADPPGDPGSTDLPASAGELGGELDLEGAGSPAAPDPGLRWQRSR